MILEQIELVNHLINIQKVRPQFAIFSWRFGPSHCTINRNTMQPVKLVLEHRLSEDNNIDSHTHGYNNNQIG